MSTRTDSGFPPGLAGPAGEPPPRRRFAGLLGWGAALALAVALLLMLALMAAGPSSAVPDLPRTWPAPPWSFRLHPTDLEVEIMVYAMVLLGAAGIACGLVAVARGARPNLRLLAAGAVAAVALTAVLPPAGSTDVISYATYGRIAELGQNPYSFTPSMLRASGDPVGRQTTQHWLHTPSIYGPVETAAEWGAAELGGTSVSRIVFWLKLLFAVSFGAVALGLDRVLRRNPAARARAHLLWTLNPLMLWAVVAGGHCDALTAALGVLGLLVVRPRPAGPGAAGAARHRAAGSPGGYRPPSLPRSLAAGLLIGAAAGVKAPFALLGIGPAWLARRSPAALAAMAAGAAAVLVPAYLPAGHAAVADLSHGSTLVAFNSFWRLLFHFSGGFKPGTAPHIVLISAEVLGLVLAVLLLWRLPRGYDDLPAVRPALAVMLAWLLVWPLQRPWYDAIAFALLAVFPATRLDWVVLIRAVPATIAMATTGVGFGAPAPLWVGHLDHAVGWTVTPLIMLAAVVAVAALCVIGAWAARRPPPLAGLTAA